MQPFFAAILNGSDLSAARRENILGATEPIEDRNALDDRLNTLETTRKPVRAKHRDEADPLARGDNSTKPRDPPIQPCGCVRSFPVLDVIRRDLFQDFQAQIITIRLNHDYERRKAECFS
jgi:hypothetical protein